MSRQTKHDDEMRSHYDFSGGVRGKYAARYAEGTHTIVAPDVAEMFPDGTDADDALRTLVRISDTTIRGRAVPKKRRG
jgi:hypothetical protein